MKKYFVYILQSSKNGHYYTGHAKDVQTRLTKHNKGRVKATKSGVPWKIVYTEKQPNKHEAYRKEFQIKKYKGGNAFKKLVDNGD